MKSGLFLTLVMATFPIVANAAAFTSAGSGNWDAPASWTPSGAPNPFLFDSATIGTGHTINYNGVGTAPFPGGNLVVANGNSITVDGGTLTQGWVPGAPPPFGTAIAIGATGPGSGAGTLTISNAGVVDTGTANALAIGVSISAVGSAVGNGTVNLNDGILRMGAGSAAPSPGAQGLALGVDTGATGIINLGDGTGLADTALLDLATNNAALTLGTRLSAATGGTGTIIIKSDGKLSQGTAEATIGGAVGTGVLTVAGGAYAGTTGLLTVANGGTGTLNVNSGALTTGGEVRVGIATGGTGNFNLNGGTTTITGETNIGRNAGGVGVITLAGGTANVGVVSVGRDGGNGTLTASSGTLTATGDVIVGRDGGTGLATVTGGTVAADHHEIGFGGTSTGTLNISGGTYSSTNYFNIGHDGGVGVINQTGGTVSFGQWMAIGLGGGPAGSKYDISAGNLTSGAGVEVGSDRDGSMTISGTANITTGGLHAGLRTNSIGLITQTGGTVVVGDSIIGGGQSAGQGTYNKSGGSFTSNNLTVGSNGGNGTFTLTGGATTVGNAATNEQGLFIAAKSDHNGGGGATGIVNIQNGATMNMSGWMEIGAGAGSTGSLNVTGTGSTFNGTGQKDFQVGYNGGNGSLNITAGGKMNQNWWINVARGAGSTGSLLVDGAGSTLTKTGGRLIIGEDGSGTMMVRNGGKIQDDSGDRFMVGKNTGGTGVATITGTGSSYIKNGGDIWVGSDDDGADQGVGTLHVTDNAVFSHPTGGGFLIGSNGTGTVNVNTNATLTHGPNSDIIVGSGGTGVGNLNIASGGKVNNNWWTIISDNDSSKGTVKIDGAGSQMNIAATDQRFVVGRSGEGILEVTNGGQLNATTGEMHVGMWGGDGALPAAKGTVTVDTGGQINGATGQSNGDPGARGGMRLFLGTDKRNAGPTTGNFNMKDGSASFASMTIGNNGMATVNQTGGTMNSNTWTEIGQDRDAGTHRPIYNMLGGTLNTQSLSIGQRRNGAMTMTGGTINVGNNGTVQTNYWGGFAIGNAGPTEDGGSHGDGIFNMSGGTLNLSEETNIGNQGGTKGVWNLIGGTVNYQVGDRRIHVGRRGDGTMTISGGTINGMQGFNVGAEAAPAGNPATKGVLTIALDNPAGVIQAGDLYVGYGNRPTSGQTVGTVNITQGTLRTDGGTEVGRGGAVDGATVGGKGTVNVDGDTAKWEHSLGGTADLQVGYEGGVGALNIINGGTVNHNWWLNLGRGGASNGTLKVADPGSTLNFTNNADLNVNIGEDGTGVANIIDEGRVNIGTLGALWVARNAGSKGTINLLSGGVIQAPQIIAGGGTAAFNIDEGKIIANKDQADYFPGWNAGNSQIGSGGLTFDTQGFTVKANNIMDGDGGITKQGSGTLILAGNNLFFGDVTIEAGNVQIDGSVAGGVVTTPNTILSGIGTIEGSITTNGGTISPGDGAGIGDLTVDGDITLNSTAHLFLTITDEAPGGFDRIINDLGMFSANGASLEGSFTDTTYTYGVTEYKFVTGDIDTTIWGNSTLIPAEDLLQYSLPAGSREVMIDGQRFWLKQGSWSLVIIPEPSTLATGLAGLAMLGMRRRRR